jgi:hypothetical protein
MRCKDEYIDFKHECKAVATSARVTTMNEGTNFATQAQR